MGRWGAEAQRRRGAEVMRRRGDGAQRVISLIYCFKEGKKLFVLLKTGIVMSFVSWFDT